jgi:hypothetical protein
LNARAKMSKRVRAWGGGEYDRDEELASALLMSVGETPPPQPSVLGPAEAPSLSEEDMIAVACAVSGGAAPGDPRVAQLVAQQERVLSRLAEELASRGSVGATQAGRALYAQASSASSDAPHNQR